MKNLRTRCTTMVLAAAVMTTIFAGCSGGKTESKPAGAPAGSTEPQASVQKVDFPKGDITFLIPSAPGGGNDLTVRSVIPGMERALNTKIVPENKSASRGALAFMDVANAKPDGHKLYFNSMTSVQLQYSGVPEAKIEKLVPVAQLVEDAAVFYVRSEAPWKNIKELVDHLKASPEKLKTANTGLGAIWHIVDVTFAKAVGVEDKLHYVSFPSGSTPMLTALVSGEVDLVITGPADAKAFTDSGKIRPIGVMTDERYPTIPDVATLKEQGFDVSYPIWRGIFTTAGTDEATLQLLSDAAKAACESEEFKKYASFGMPAKFKDYKEFKTVVEKEDQLLSKLMPEIMAEANAANAEKK